MKTRSYAVSASQLGFDSLAILDERLFESSQLVELMSYLDDDQSSFFVIPVQDLYRFRSCWWFMSMHAIARAAREKHREAC